LHLGRGGYTLTPNAQLCVSRQELLIGRGTRGWSKLLLQIDEAFNGNPPSAFVPAVHSTFRLRDQALVLLASPLPDHPGRHAGPTFDWTEP
jgi:hypothetical protein